MNDIRSDSVFIKFLLPKYIKFTVNIELSFLHSKNTGSPDNEDQTIDFQSQTRFLPISNLSSTS